MIDSVYDAIYIFIKTEMKNLIKICFILGMQKYMLNNKNKQCNTY